MSASHSKTDVQPGNWYARIPLYLKIVVALILGIGLGYLLGPKAAQLKPYSMALL